MAIALSGALLAFVSGCDRKKPASAQPDPSSTSSTTTSASNSGQTASSLDLVSSPAFEGDAREAARAVFGAPPKPGRLIGTIEAATNGDPQVNAAGVLATTGAQGKVFTVYATADGLHVGGPIDLGNVRYLATDGPHVCASDRRTVRCARVDGAGAGQRPTGTSETSGLWGGPGVMLRATAEGLETGLEASEDGFATARRVITPRRRAVVAAVVETERRWTSIMMATEGTAKPRYGLTIDGGKTSMADFGALDRTGWSAGDRLWPDQLVTGAFSTETVVAERGEKQSTIKLPWSAAGGFAFARRALLLFGRGASGTGGFLLVEFPSRHVTTFVPAGAQPFIAAGRVGGAIVAITTEGKVLAWEG